MYRYRLSAIISATVIALLAIGAATAAAQPMPRIAISDDGKSFVLAGSGERFVPWGFNYDHDREGRLLEDYWVEQWPTVEEDFAEMKRLGANVVRVHLQLGKFMDAADQPSERSLAQLERLLDLAEREGLYLDITGLGCYHKHDVPPWYDELDRDERWAVQARFWEAVASRCAGSPAVFCYDLMNEPVVPGGSGRRDDWLGPAFAGKHFVQFIALETGGRPRVEIAREWTSQLVEAIRRHDRGRLITVGLVPWSLDRPGLTSGFVPSRIAPLVDFIAVHVYPESDKLDDARATLEGFDLGKPLVVEETFPLKCSPAELGEVIDGSRDIVDGWIGFYWGTTPEELKESESIGDALTRGWLELFQEKADEIKGP